MTSDASLPVAGPDAASPPRAARLQVPLVVARGISKRWKRQAPVLEQVDLLFPSGTLVAVTGANGAGKTTLLRILAGLIDPDAGTVSINGLHPRRDRREFYRSIGFLSASHGGLYARMSARRHLEYWARLALLPRVDRDLAVARALDQFALTSIADRRVDRLSMGQRQRLRLAMAFVHNPDVVLLDEPWNSLDGEGFSILRLAIEALVQKGGTAVCCVPTEGDIGSDADDVYVVADGRVERA